MEEEKVKKIKNSMYSQVNTRGYVTIVDTFMDIGILEQEQYDRWRKGQIPYLEKVCHGNLHKLSNTVNEIYKLAKQFDLKESYTFYKRLGKGKKEKLRFSKTGQDNIEKRYAMHFILNKIES